MISLPAHFTQALPNVDHMAFVTSKGGLDEVERQLKNHNVYYKKCHAEIMGVSQIFFFDPGECIREPREMDGRLTPKPLLLLLALYP